MAPSFLPPVRPGCPAGAAAWPAADGCAGPTGAAGWPDPGGGAGPGDPGLWFRSLAGAPLPDPAALAGDARFMALALAEGLAGIGTSSPNPSVGCVLVRDGRVIGRGGHRRAGGPHAEVLALQDAFGRGHDPAGATAYVTLEPCCHHGRTPPCADALVAAGIARVVAGIQDPDPRVSGGGLRRLREAGVAVASGVLAEACEALHAAFCKRVRTGLPLVVQLVLPRPEASPEVSLRRLRASLLLGAQAVCADVPSLVSLDLRSADPAPPPVPAGRTLWRVLLDPAGRLHPAHRFMAPLPDRPLLRVLAGPREPLPFVEDLVCGDARGRLDLPGLLRHLVARGADCVLVEGNGPLAAAFSAQGLVDVLVGPA